MGMLSDFRKFAMKGNVIDLAVGFVVGAAFTTIVKTLVDDVIMPPLGLLLGGTDFSNYFITLKDGAKAAGPYFSLADAQAAAAVTLNYGKFINSIITFIIVALAMFLVIRFYTKIDEKISAAFAGPKPEPGEPTDKKCPYCLTTIPFRATRCPACTSQLEESAVQ